MRRELIGPALAGKPLAGAFPAHEAGEGLVQGHVIGHPKPLVGDLVDQQFGQLRLRPIDEGAEQRIVEVAERGVGGDPAHIGLQALVGQALRGAAGGILREVAPIGGAAREGMAPLAGRQREGRCGEDVPQHMAALKTGEAPVAAAGVQAHLGFGEPQNLPGPPQPGLERRRGGRVRQQRIDWLRRPQHTPMPTHRLGVVAEVPAAAEGHGQQQHRHVSACCLCVQGSSPNPNPPLTSGRGLILTMRRRLRAGQGAVLVVRYRRQVLIADGAPAVAVRAVQLARQGLLSKQDRGLEASH